MSKIVPCCALEKTTYSVHTVAFLRENIVENFPSLAARVHRVAYLRGTQSQKFSFGAQDNTKYPVHKVLFLRGTQCQKFSFGAPAAQVHRVAYLRGA